MLCQCHKHCRQTVLSARGSQVLVQCLYLLVQHTQLARLSALVPRLMAVLLSPLVLSLPDFRPVLLPPNVLLWLALIGKEHGCAAATKRAITVRLWWAGTRCC